MASRWLKALIISDDLIVYAHSVVRVGFGCNSPCETKKRQNALAEIQSLNSLMMVYLFNMIFKVILIYMQISVYRDKHNCVFLAIPKYQVDNRIADEFLTWITVICFRSPNYWLLPPDAKSSSDGIRWVPRLVMEYFPCFSFPTCHFPNNHQYYHD